jgi:hypothetical protein
MGFIELGRTLAKDNHSASKIKKDEEDYFRFLGPEREAIARKLTMMAELSEGFVADSRLWQWIDEATAHLSIFGDVSNLGRSEIGMRRR